VLTDAELVAIWKACGDDDFGRIIRLLILLAARRSEISGLSAAELDMERGTWTLPAARSKNKRPLLLSLPAPALDIINSVPRWAGRDQLFGARARSGFNGWDRGKRKLDEQLGSTVKPWRIHDLRRSVATKMADIGVEPHVIEQILNHVSGHKAGPAGIYNRSSYERQVKAALARWSEHVLALVEGRASKVVALTA
jgi:integrase